MNPTRKVKVLSRYFKENVQLVAAMCPPCYEMEDECKIVGITRKLAEKSNKLLRNKHKRNMLRGNSSSVDTIAESSEDCISIESDTDCDIISISSATSCCTDSSEEDQSDDSPESSNCTDDLINPNTCPLSNPDLNLVEPIDKSSETTLEDTTSSKTTEDLSEIDNEIQNENTSSSFDIHQSSPKLQSNQLNLPKIHDNTLKSLKPTEEYLGRKDSEDYLEEPQTMNTLKFGEPYHQLTNEEDLLENPLSSTTCLQKPASPSNANLSEEATTNHSKSSDFTPGKTSSASSSSLLTTRKDIQEDPIEPLTLIEVVENPQGRLHKELNDMKRLKFGRLYDQLTEEDVSEDSSASIISLRKSVSPILNENLENPSKSNLSGHVSKNHSKSPDEMNLLFESKDILESPTLSKVVGIVKHPQRIEELNETKFGKLYDQLPTKEMMEDPVSSMNSRMLESQENNPTESNLSGDKTRCHSESPNFSQPIQTLQHVCSSQSIKLTESKGGKDTPESLVESKIARESVDPEGIIFKESIRKNRLKFDKLYDAIPEDDALEVESIPFLRSSKIPLQTEYLENTSKSNISGDSLPKQTTNESENFPNISRIDPKTLTENSEGNNTINHPQNMSLIPFTQLNPITKDDCPTDIHKSIYFDQSNMSAPEIQQTVTSKSLKLSKLLDTTSRIENQIEGPSKNRNIPSLQSTIIENHPQTPPKPPKSPDYISLLEFEQFFKDTITKLNDKYVFLSQTDSSGSDNEESEPQLLDDTNTNRKSRSLSEVAIPVLPTDLGLVKQGMLLDNNIPIENSSKFLPLLDDINTNTICETSHPKENDIPITDTLLRCEGEKSPHFISPNHPQFCVDTSTNTNSTTNIRDKSSNNTSSYFSQPLSLLNVTKNTISESSLLQTNIPVIVKDSQRSKTNTTTDIPTTNITSNTTTNIISESAPFGQTKIQITVKGGKVQECPREKSPDFKSFSQPAPITEHTTSEDIQLTCSQPSTSRRKSRTTRKNVLTRKQKKAILEENAAEMPPGALKAMWTPPKSPHCLIEEEYFRNPWGLLVASIFLNKTSGVVAKPYIDSFLKNYPTPEAVVERSPDDFEEYFEALGLRKRSRAIWRMSQEFLTKKWRHARDLHGIGKYGDDAFRIFCIGDLEAKPNDRYLKIYHAWVKMKQRDENRDD